ncbi:MAG: head decoration protein [Sporomusaceae bacterium]|nr:head decoration protein [Sporomusaceae bacterium]
MPELVRDAGSFTYDGLIGGCEPPLFVSVETLAQGTGIYVRGTILGKLITSKQLKTVNSANNDGSQTAYAILLDDAIDTTTAAVPVRVAKRGIFNRSKLTAGGSDTATTHEDTLRDLNIYLTDSKGVGN